MPDNIIHVPRPSPSAFNKNRPLAGNLLLRKQVEHFQKVESELPPDLQTGIDGQTITTEGQAGDYIRRITAVLAAKGKVRRAT